MSQTVKVANKRYIKTVIWANASQQNEQETKRLLRKQGVSCMNFVSSECHSFEFGFLFNVVIRYLRHFQKLYLATDTREAAEMFVEMVNKWFETYNLGKYLAAE